ncbi:MAG: polysaccharide deacetylase family protein [Bacillota bacterium]|nr:polysaccharide deacetylase family protein [Bacillota bacterium]
MKQNYKSLENNSFKTNRALFIAFVAAAIVTYVIWTMSQTTTDTYNDEEEFIKYADGQFEMSQSFQMTGVERTEYEYGEPISYAVDYASCDYDNVAAFRDIQIENMKTSYSESIDPEDDQQKALLLKTGVTSTEMDAVNLMIFERRTAEVEEDMTTVYKNMHTYQFSTKTGDQLVPEQIFKPDYKEHCSEYFYDYFSENYDKDQLSKAWKTYIKPNEDNFNEFIITDAGISFFFDEGTVLEKSEGIVYVGIAKALADDILRKKIIHRYIDPNKPMVALTYDDGPGLVSEDRILNCLDSYGAVATFFYQGTFISGREDKIARAKELGCELGNHTWSHPVLTSLNDAELNAQVVNTNEAIKAACGKYPTVFRPSYGESNDKVHAAFGLPVILWTVDTLDWESRDGKKIFDHVTSQGNLDGKIILMHSIHDATADATEKMIPWLKAQGYQLVTVSELIKYKTGADPVPGKVYRTFE